MNILPVIMDSLKESLVIISIIFVLMVIVEWIMIRYKHNLSKFSSKNRSLTYVISSAFGIIPGCTGTFVMDSLYMMGLLTFGGIVAVMISTSGDEAFLMLSLAISGKISWTLLLTLMVILFVLGILGAYIADFFSRKLKLKLAKKHLVVAHQKYEHSFSHFMKTHVYKHIIKKHILSIFLWVFGTLVVLGMAKPFISSSTLFAGDNMFIVLIISAVIGILPISGPNAFLVVMFSEGLIPFSVLLTNSIVQDGHGLLPILGFSINDSIYMKAFNFIFGVIVGSIFMFLGM